MSKLRILYVEDNELDAILVGRELARDGLQADLDRIWTEPEFKTKLRAGGFDLILCDNRLPGFSGMKALALARELKPETPFIFVSGTIGEEVAVEALKSGATDYVIKDRIGRLPSAVRRALQTIEDRSKRQEAERALRTSEEQFRQIQKLEAIGLLAGGVAHDFNNLLTVINGRSLLMMRKLPPDDPARKEFELIYRTGERAAALTRQLLAFSSKQQLEPVVMNLNAIISDLTKMLKRMISESIQLTLELHEPLPNIMADPSQMEQIVMNLVVNARDAMPHGGTLCISTGIEELGAPALRHGLHTGAGRHVRISIRDSGTGMDEATVARIFEPFFTTKSPGKGTGLGLSTVYGILKQSAGGIEVDSAPGTGTTFHILLPAVLAESTARKSNAAAPRVTGGNETVLVVEDEEGIRGTIAEILAIDGYQVLTARTGQDAFDLVQNGTKPIDMIVTDLVMPNMGGVDLLKAVHKIQPGMRVLFVSGYAVDAAEAGELGDAPCLQKPFTPTALLNRVREVLSKA